MILWESKMVLVHPPRCGGTSIETAINPEYWNHHPWEKHRNAQELYDIIKWRGENPADFQWFGLIRHPCDRMKSMLRREYWNYTVVLPRQKPAIDLVFFQLQFASLVQPVAHEGRNLSLVDFYPKRHGLDKEIKITYYDTRALQELAKIFGINELPHLQKSPNETNRTHFLFDCITFARFKSDFKTFKYNYSSAQLILLPLSMFIIFSFRILHRVAWWTRNTLRSD